MRVLGCNASFNVRLQQKKLQDIPHTVNRMNPMTRLATLAEMLFENSKKTYCPTHFKCKWLLTEDALSGCLVDVDFVDETMNVILRSKNAEQCRFIIDNLGQWRNELWCISERIELDYARV